MCTHYLVQIIYISARQPSSAQEKPKSCNSSVLSSQILLKKKTQKFKITQYEYLLRKDFKLLRNLTSFIFLDGNGKCPILPVFNDLFHKLFFYKINKNLKKNWRNKNVHLYFTWVNSEEIWYPRSKWDNTLFDIQDLMRQYIIWYPRSQWDNTLFDIKNLNETIHYLISKSNETIHYLISKI